MLDEEIGTQSLRAAVLVARGDLAVAAALLVAQTSDPADPVITWQLWRRYRKRMQAMHFTPPLAQAAE